IASLAAGSSAALLNRFALLAETATQFLKRRIEHCLIELEELNRMPSLVSSLWPRTRQPRLNSLFINRPHAITPCAWSGPHLAAVAALPIRITSNNFSDAI